MINIVSLIPWFKKTLKESEWLLLATIEIRLVGEGRTYKFPGCETDPDPASWDANDQLTFVARPDHHFWPTVLQTCPWPSLTKRLPHIWSAGRHTEGQINFLVSHVIFLTTKNCQLQRYNLARTDTTSVPATVSPPHTWPASLLPLPCTEVPRSSQNIYL